MVRLPASMYLQGLTTTTKFWMEAFTCKDMKSFWVNKSSQVWMSRGRIVVVAVGLHRYLSVSVSSVESKHFPVRMLVAQNSPGEGYIVSLSRVRVSLQHNERESSGKKG